MLKIIVPVFAFIAIMFGTVDQIRLLLKYKDARAVSLIRTLLAMIGSVLWIFYAWQIKNFLLVYVNLTGFILALVLVIIIWHYRK